MRLAISLLFLGSALLSGCLAPAPPGMGSSEVEPQGEGLPGADWGGTLVLGGTLEGLTGPLALRIEADVQPGATCHLDGWMHTRIDGHGVGLMEAYESDGEVVEFLAPISSGQRVHANWDYGTGTHLLSSSLPLFWNGTFYREFDSNASWAVTIASRFVPEPGDHPGDVGWGPIDEENAAPTVFALRCKGGTPPVRAFLSTSPLLLNQETLQNGFSGGTRYFVQAQVALDTGAAYHSDAPRVFTWIEEAGATSRILLAMPQGDRSWETDHVSPDGVDQFPFLVAMVEGGPGDYALSVTRVGASIGGYTVGVLFAGFDVLPPSYLQASPIPTGPEPGR